MKHERNPMGARKVGNLRGVSKETARTLTNSISMKRDEHNEKGEGLRLIINGIEAAARG